MKLRSLSSVAALGLSSALWSGLARAQLPENQPLRLPAFGRSIVSNEDTTALVSNPGNLAFLPGAELRWSSVYLNEQTNAAYQGHAFAFGFPIPFLSMATGLRLDLVSPPQATAQALYGRDTGRYQWLTWGLALKATDYASLGFTLQRSYSNRAATHDLFDWSAGVTVRPSDYVGIAVVGDNLRGASTAAGGHIDRTYHFGAALRPLRSRFLEIGAEGGLVDADVRQYWIPRATLGVDIPELGRLRGDFEYADPTNDHGLRHWLASASMAFAFNGPGGSTELAGGSIFGNELGTPAGHGADNLAFEVAFRGFREANGAEAPQHNVRIRLESTPSVRGHTALLRQLWEIAENEPSVRGVVLELRTSPASSLAHVQELRDAVFFLRQAGKKVLCSLEDADGASLYLCSAADRIVVNPAGGVRFAGMRSRYYYVASLLEKLGIKADFVRIGAHKSAPEEFMRDGASEASRADKIDLLQQFEKHFTAGISAGRKISAEDLRARFAKGPFVAAEARVAGLVDGYAFDDQLEAEAGKLVGQPMRLIDDKRAERSPQFFGSNAGIAMVYVDGDMVDGRSQTIPLLGTRLVGSYTIAETLKQVRENPNVGAVVLRVETGGGSAMAADVIYRELQLTAAVKPVVVSMGSAAASGGYYISAAGTYVLANPLSVTGSIGIFYGKADVAELLRKIGVTVEVYKTGPRADGESIFRPFTSDEHRELEHKVAQFYDVFLTRVAQGRKISKSQVDAVGQGRVWTGEQALERKLVDELGGLRQALAVARKLGHLTEHAPIVELPPPDSSLLGRLLGVDGVKEQAQTAGPLLPGQILEALRSISPFVVHSGDSPLALMEWMPSTE